MYSGQETSHPKQHQYCSMAASWHCIMAVASHGQPGICHPAIADRLKTITIKRGCQSRSQHKEASRQDLLIAAGRQDTGHTGLRAAFTVPLRADWKARVMALAAALLAPPVAPKASRILACTSSTPDRQEITDDRLIVMHHCVTDKLHVLKHPDGSPCIQHQRPICASTDQCREASKVGVPKGCGGSKMCITGMHTLALWMAADMDWLEVPFQRPCFSFRRSQADPNEFMTFAVAASANPCA